MENLSYSKLNEVPILNNDTIYLDISHNNITELNNLPSNLYYLNCSHNKIKRIENLPDTLQILVCSFNEISKLIISPNIHRLNCMFNKIKHINFTNNLEVIIINNNLLTNISYLPTSLKVLFCANNMISKLPDKLPEQLIILNCASNNILQLPRLPKSLEEIYFQNNIITKITIDKNIKHYNIQNNPLVKFEDNMGEDEYYIVDNTIKCIDFENMEEIDIDKHLSLSEDNIIIKSSNDKFICYSKKSLINLFENKMTTLPYYRENILDWESLRTPCNIFDLQIVKINKETFFKIIPI